MCMPEKFSEWINAELNQRGWSVRELARRAGVSHGAINNVINELRKPGSELCSGIAKALKVPPEEVFRHAGILPKASEKTVNMQEMVYLFDQLEDDDQRNVIAMLRGYVKERRERYL